MRLSYQEFESLYRSADEDALFRNGGTLEELLEKRQVLNWIQAQTNTIPPRWLYGKYLLFFLPRQLRSNLNIQFRELKRTLRFYIEDDRRL